MKLSALAVLMALSCSVLSACDGDVNATIARAAAPVLDGMLPSEFEHFSIDNGSSFSRNESCRATVIKAHREEWFAGPGGTITIEGPRSEYDTMSLTADKVDGHWQITESDLDPRSMDISEFERRVSECVQAFDDARTGWAEQDKKDRARTEHNLKSWETGVAPLTSGAR